MKTRYYSINEIKPNQIFDFKIGKRGRNMPKRRKIKQAWIYQERETPKPWAVHVFCELQSGWGEPRICATVFHEDMFKGHDDSIYNQRIVSPESFAYIVDVVLSSYGIETTDDDIEQLVHWWLDLINLW